MKSKKNEICLLNDSFPPLIDGVANVVVNYAKILTKEGYDVSVVTPSNLDAEKDDFEFPVFRYPSIDMRKSIGYTAGNPFSIPTIKKLKQRNISILHSHCPMMSHILARSLRENMNVPLIMTYHTKYEIDIANSVKLKAAQAIAIKAVIDNVRTCDEIWTVSDGAGKSLQNLGYQGDYIVMPNGVDMPRGRVSDEKIHEAVKDYDLPEDVPMFIFVGRLMWYKGLRIIIDALAALKSHDIDFRMVFIGGGGDEEEVKAQVEELKLGDKIFFTGPIRDRSTLAAWYCRADLFLFPSTFDTNGLVVREASAYSLGAVLIKDSCAAEGVTDGLDGLLIDENAASLAVCLMKYMNNKDLLKSIGENASANLYYSWDEAVHDAMERYEIVLDNFASGVYKKKKNVTEGLFAISGDLFDFITYTESRLKTRFNEKEEIYQAITRDRK